MTSDHQHDKSDIATKSNTRTKARKATRTTSSLITFQAPTHSIVTDAGQQFSLAILLRMVEFCQKKGVDWHMMSQEMNDEAVQGEKAAKGDKIITKRVSATPASKHAAGCLTGSDLCESRTTFTPLQGFYLTVALLDDTFHHVGSHVSVQ